MAAIVDVSLAPNAPEPADACIVIDCIRASTVVAEALAAGYRRVVCVGDLDRARAVAAASADSVLGGEHNLLRPDGFALGNSPSEYRTARCETLVLCTTNGTRALVAAAGGDSTTLICGALVNLEAVSRAVDGAARISIVCAGANQRPALDDVYAAGRYVERLLELDPARAITDAAAVARAAAERLGAPANALPASGSAARLRAAGLGDDVRACSRLSVLSVVPTSIRAEADRVELVAAALRSSAGSSSR